MVNILIDNLYVYVLVFVRIAGVISFNPIMARSNIPNMVRAAMIFFSTICIAPSAMLPENFTVSTISLVVSIGRELLVGFVLAYVFNVFYYMLFAASDLLDMQFGFSMAKVMDPGTSVQTAITGNILNIFFIGYLFATNTHRLLIRLIVFSYDVLPVGAASMVIDGLPDFAFEIFKTAFMLAMRLTFPFVAVEIIIELFLGVMMKLIPQIHIFIINMQIKIILSIVMLYLLSEPIAGFFDNYILLMFDYMQNALYLIAGS
ncbi:MAG: flagellar biosynthetic protein FliR [Oscillospiraceae bacterium]